MTLLLILFWISVVSLFGVAGAYYANRYCRPDALVALYAIITVTASFMVSKSAIFDLGYTEITAPVTALFFAVTFLLTDVVNEKFGRKETIRMIAISLFVQISVVIFTHIVLSAQGAAFFTDQETFERLFGGVPRVIAASLIAFFVSESFDAFVYDRFRRWTNGAHLWTRNVFSSIPSMLLDSILFITIAFYGVFPIVPVIIGNTVIKWLVGVVDIPFMYLSRRVLGASKAVAV